MTPHQALERSRGSLARAGARTDAGPERFVPVHRPVPSGFSVVSPILLANMRELPCDLFVQSGRHAVLFATVGADAPDIASRIKRGMEVLVRAEDDELLAHALVASIPGVLADESLSVDERSLTVYSLASQSVRPLLASGNRTDTDRLELSHDMIDAITQRLMLDDRLIWSMVATMQKHLETHTHALNTAVYSVVLAERLGFKRLEALRDVGRGALLHDIGKVKVPRRILDKPGPLDDKEWVIMKRHPEDGHDIVTRALGFTPTYAHIIAEHHERADGSGYPGQRLGGQVAMDSQLVAIADAFDAITSARSYKPASSAFEAVRTMRFRMAGQFNDEILQEFIGMLGGWQELRKHELRALELVANG